MKGSTTRATSRRRPQRVEAITLHSRQKYYLLCRFSSSAFSNAQNEMKQTHLAYLPASRLTTPLLFLPAFQPFPSDLQRSSISTPETERTSSRSSFCQIHRRRVIRKSLPAVESRRQRRISSKTSWRSLSTRISMI